MLIEPRLDVHRSSDARGNHLVGQRSLGEDIRSQNLVPIVLEFFRQPGIEVLFDDRNVRGGVKFKDADLLGIPVRITIGKKSIAEGKAEIKLRSESESEKIDINKIAGETANIVKNLKDELNA